VTEGPYTVFYCLPFAQSVEVGNFDFPGALEEVKRLRGMIEDGPAHIGIFHKDKADIDCDSRGTIFDTGLTDEERDALLEIL
jgi:hypothetical protein